MASPTQLIRSPDAVGAATAVFTGNPIQTFDQASALRATTSHTYWLPYAPRSSIFSGGVTSYGSGTITALLMRNSSEVVATLTITGTGLFVVDAVFLWEVGDSMAVSLSAVGSGSRGFTAVVM